ncbi:MAG: class I adenylate-forming enzyme family protein [Acidimicrobiales bacterium]|nr:class I adenylate-forming enzyme family protein [Acidimicrobiales bacterium]
MKKNIARYVMGALIADAHAPCLVGSSELTRGDLLARVRGRIDELTDAGVGADEFVVVLCGRGERFWVDLLALWVIGAKPVCLEPDVPDDHGANVLAITGATRLCAAGIDPPPAFAGLEPVGDTDPVGAAVSSLRDLPWAGADTQPDLAGLIFTSGTTGLPKGVPLTHEQLVMNALATRDRLRLRRTDRLMIATPFRFISSISHFVVTLMCGAAFHGVETTLMPKDLMTELADNRITAFGGSPFHAQFVALAGTERLPDLRWLMSSGDHLPVSTIDQLLAAFPDLELHVVYGMAEMGGRICTLPPGDIVRKKGSVGLPISGIELDVYDESGAIAAPGEIGEVHVDGPFRFDGYHENPAANDAVLGPRGFHTGDKAYRDEDGYLFMAGRSDAVFKRSGLKVSAQVITDALKDLDSVEDAFVRAAADRMEGHVPVAYVVVRGDFDRTETVRRLREDLATNHIPKTFVPIPSIPRTGSGKVDRRALDALIESLETS